MQSFDTAQRHLFLQRILLTCEATRDSTLAVSINAKRPRFQTITNIWTAVLLLVHILKGCGQIKVTRRHITMCAELPDRNMAGWFDSTSPFVLWSVEDIRGIYIFAVMQSRT